MTFWKCPACGIEIRHNAADDRPRREQVYRCHICRLELVFDETTGTLATAPLPTDERDQSLRRTA